MLDQCSRGWHDFRPGGKFCPRCGFYLEEDDRYATTLRVKAVKFPRSTDAQDANITSVTAIYEHKQQNKKDRIILIVGVLALCVLAALIYFLPDADKPMISFLLAGCSIAYLLYKTRTLRGEPVQMDE